MIALWASYELWLASPSYDAPSVQLKERGNHIITSAKHSHNSKLTTKSVGANIHEAQYAQGTKDFISKFEIALKECNESEYWLELLFETNSIDENEFKKMQGACVELRRMLVATVTTTKSKQ